MSKKLLAVILSISLLMSAVPTFAASVTDGTTGLITYTDDFNSAEPGSYTKATYPSGTLTSDVFATLSKTGGYDIVAEAGRDGSNVLKLRQGSTTGAADSIAVTRAVNMADTNNVMELTYDICISKNTTYADYDITNTAKSINLAGYYSTTSSAIQKPFFALGKGSDGKWTIINGITRNATALCEYTEGSWYKVVNVWRGTKRTGYILDSAGNVIASNSETRDSATTYEGIIQLVSAQIPGRCIEGEILIDNAVLKVYSDSKVAPSITASSITDGATGVSSNTNSVSVSFDQPISTSSVTLKAGGETLETCTIAQDTTKLYTYNISWQSALTAGTQYTLDLSGVKNSGNAAMASTAAISFTTEEPGIEKIVDNFEKGADATSSAYNLIKDGAPAYADVPLTTGDAQQVGYTTLVSGFTGNALQITTGASGTGQCIKPLRTVEAYTPAVSNSQYESFVATYRFNLKDMADVGTETKHKSSSTTISTTNGSEIRFGAWTTSSIGASASVARIVTSNGKPVIFGDSGVSAEITEDHWYNIILAVNGAEQSFALIDAEGADAGKIVWQGTKTASYTPGSALYITAYSGNRYESGSYMYNDSQTVLVDDFTLWRIKPWVASHKLTAGVTGDNGSYAMTFNQPVVIADDMIYVSEVTGDDPAEYNRDIDFAADVTYGNDFCSANITLTDLPLMTTCVLDYSGIEGVSGAAFAEPASCITPEFTTEADATGILTLAGEAVYNDGIISFNLYNSDVDSATPKVYMAFYKKNAFLGVETPAEAVSISAGEKTSVTIDASEYDDFDLVRVFAWDDELTPLMSAYSRKIVVVSAEE